MGKKYYKIKKSTITWVVGIILFFVWVYWPVEEGTTFIFEGTTFKFEEGTILTFEINETGKLLTGDVFFDDNYFGFTEGRIFISPFDDLPKEFTLEGIHEGIKFEITYKLPKNYLEDGELRVIVTEEELESFDIEKIDSFFGIEEPHWGYMPLTYRIDNCIERQTNLTRLAFEKIEFETGYIVDFEETSENPDILIYCDPTISGNEELTIAEAFPYVDPYFENLIAYADITFYGQGGICLTGYPALEVHEILHTFGFEHSPFNQNIMAPYSADYSRKCETTKIDDEYVSCLRYIYSNGEIGECSIKNYMGDSPWII